MSGHVEVVKTLLATGANADLQIDWRRLSIVCCNFIWTCLEVVRTLVAAGANVNQEYNGQSLLSFAPSRGQADVVDVLLEVGPLSDDGFFRLCLT